jgi:uncharacterized integral membrane protein
MRFFFFLVLVVLAGAVAIFAVQNQETVTLQFLEWSASYPLAFLVGVVYFLGMLSGWSVVGMVRRSWHRIADDTR